jgi:hypothetical protein
MEAMKLAPIALFVYARPEHTRQTLESLAANDLAQDSELIVFADGPKAGASAETLANIQKTRDLITERNWCGKVTLVASEVNKGLAGSIVSGVTKVVNEHGRIIVLEDDLHVAPGFLRFMNEALELYEHDAQVMHIAGYMFPVKAKLPDTFFYRSMFCWGWATWASAWKHLNLDAADLYKQLEARGFPEDFNVHPSNEFYESIRANMDGRIITWAIKWLASIYLANGLCLVPGKSLVRNIGHDGTGVHCGSNDAMAVQPIANSVPVKRIAIEPSKAAFKAMYAYYDRLQYNLKNRVLNKIATFTGWDI